MLQSARMRKVVALCVVAAWAYLVGVSSADAIEDARKISPHEDGQSDQAVQQALATPAVKPASLSSRVTPPHPTFEPVHHPLAQIASSTQRITPNAWDATLHGPPPLLHSVRLFQLFSVYRL